MYLFQSGPTEETIECREHERVKSTRGVSFLPIVRGSPPPPLPEFFLFFFILITSMFVLMGLNAFGTTL